MRRGLDGPHLSAAESTLKVPYAALERLETFPPRRRAKVVASRGSLTRALSRSVGKRRQHLGDLLGGRSL
jgi:hypothetical protein